MTVTPVAALQLPALSTLIAPDNAGAVSSASGFTSVAQRLGTLEQSLSAGEAASAGFANGTSNIPTHTLMIRMESARLDLALALQVRNKLVEAVQEIYRTQI